MGSIVAQETINQHGRKKNARYLTGFYWGQDENQKFNHDSRGI